MTVQYNRHEVHPVSAKIYLDVRTFENRWSYMSYASIVKQQGNETLASVTTGSLNSITDV